MEQEFIDYINNLYGKDGEIIFKAFDLRRKNTKGNLEIQETNIFLTHTKLQKFWQA